MQAIETQCHTRRSCKSARRGILGVIFDALSLVRQRRRLAELDEHLLRDIGVTSEQAQKEAGRPILDASQFWRN